MITFAIFSLQIIFEFAFMMLLTHSHTTEIKWTYKKIFLMYYGAQIHCNMLSLTKTSLVISLNGYFLAKCRISTTNDRKFH